MTATKADIVRVTLRSIPNESKEIYRLKIERSNRAKEETKR